MVDQLQLWQDWTPNKDGGTSVMAVTKLESKKDGGRSVTAVSRFNCTSIGVVMS